jgi:alpha-ketoglutarate-dependent taurine dioxygenase
VYQPSVDLIEALDAFDNLAESERFCARMRLAEGDLQLVSNHSVVHARTTFIDDPLAPRHLLRLWLSLDHRSQGTGASST